jgi:hypothetical protein
LPKGGAGYLILSRWLIPRGLIAPSKTDRAAPSWLTVRLVGLNPCSFLKFKGIGALPPALNLIFLAQKLGLDFYRILFG